MPQTHPNIVLLHAHDAGRWCSPCGAPVKTPHIAGFAREGVLFRKAYCAAPTCGPSRAAMLSGQHPHQVGMFGLPGAQGWKFDDYNKHLVQQLNRWGYHTALAGCQHEVDHADISPLGYAEILSRPGRLDGECYPETIVDVEHFLAREHGKPFFLSFGVDEPHNDNLARPELRMHGKADRHSKTRYYDPLKLDSRYVAPPAHLPDLPEIRREMASLAVGAKIMDEYFGRVLWALHHYGYDENTLVIITTDHGLELPGGKKTLSDMGLGVMLLMRGPGGFRGGKVFDGLVSHLDLYPTICDLVGQEHPPWLEGRSLVPLVENRVNDGALHSEIFGEQTYHGGLEPLRCIRTERHKLVLRHFADGPRLAAAGVSGDRMTELGWLNRPLGHVELFDLYLDPTEACNRADDPAYATVREDLERRLRDWMARTGDPFPTGSFPPPPGRR
ncbi:MAG TPA: sulfatase [Opitutaceae bacterium]|nr:sulfatase [Opitutaceae bacterium]